MICNFVFDSILKKMNTDGPIGIFDSGFGGLTIFREIRKILPQYDYIYFGDNARAPYGNRSFRTVYDYTLECVKHLFELGCPLVIIACNTASAKALRTIQQKDLPNIDPKRRVLGVIRPTTEKANTFTKNKKLGILATSGTVKSNSYEIEIKKFFSDIQVFQQECPIWVPLIETGEYKEPASHYFFKKYLDKLLNQCSDIDGILLGCTHYPLVSDILRKMLPASVSLIEQGPIVAQSLKDYLARHQEMDARLSKNSKITFISSETKENFLNNIFIDFWRENDLEKINFEKIDY